MTAAEDLEELVRLGGILDERPDRLGGSSVLEFLAESLLRVRSRSGSVVPLQLNRAQAEFERQRRRRNIVLKARQMGISTWISARLFLKTITTPGTLSVQVAHTQDAAESIFQMAHRFLALLPDSLREGALKTSKVNVREMYFPALDSGFRAESAGDPNAGRGLTITNLHCSEVARWAGDARAVLRGLEAALIPSGEMILESTPQGAEGCFWEEWQRAEKTETARHFFPWWWESTYVGNAIAEESLTDEERELRAREGLSLEQLGYRRRLRAGYRELASQEFAEDVDSCFRASGSCIFDVDRLDARLTELRTVRPVRRAGGLSVWLPAATGRRYLIAVDTAGGGPEGDFAVAQVIELQSGLQCAELQSRLTVRELAVEVAKLHVEYNHGQVVVERNNHGSGVLAHLTGMMDSAHIYRSGRKQEGQQGWLTTASSRPAMLGLLGSLLAEQPELFMSERLLGECRTFVRMGHGRTGAQSGAHDDCVMAMAMAHMVRAELLEVAGIRTSVHADEQGAGALTTRWKDQRAGWPADGANV